MDRLRLVIVNHCHPEMPHVCALRAREFANALSRRGHHVVLLTETLAPDDPAPGDEAVRRAVDAHDWSLPFRLACPPRPAPLLRRARVGRLPGICSKAVLGAAYAFRGGAFADWVDGTRPLWGTLAAAFRPQATWGIFGNTGAWIIARGIAKRAGAPWLMDLKDGWGHFVPAGMRASTARRFADATAATALSEAHAIDFRRYFDGTPDVVYSGVPDEALAPTAAPPDRAGRDLVLAGSLYEPEAAAILVSGLRQWLAPFAAADRPRLRYFGADGDRLRAAAADLEGVCELDLQGYRPLPELLAALRASRVNLYVRSTRTLFHHKLIELLSCGRPIVTIGEEGDEARRIADELSGRLAGAANALDLAGRLDDAWRTSAFAPPPADRMARYGWDAQAAVLEGALERAVG